MFVRVAALDYVIVILYDGPLLSGELGHFHSLARFVLTLCLSLHVRETVFVSRDLIRGEA